MRKLVGFREWSSTEYRQRLAWKKRNHQLKRVHIDKSWDQEGGDDKENVVIVTWLKANIELLPS